MDNDKSTLFSFTAGSAIHRKEITCSTDKTAFVVFVPTNNVGAVFYPTCGNCGHLVDGKTSRCDKCDCTLDWRRQRTLKKESWVLSSMRLFFAVLCGNLAFMLFVGK